jgi:predicted  nucleic acid-binding Zn-ribbon protein
VLRLWDMMWNRFTTCEREPNEEQSDIPSVGDYRHLQRENEVLNRQLTHKTDLFDAMKTAYERDHARVAELERKVADLQSGAVIGDQLIVFYKTEIASLEKQVAELTAQRDSWKTRVNEADKRMAAIDALIHPAVQIGPQSLAESVGEETAVIDRAACVQVDSVSGDRVPYYTNPDGSVEMCYQKVVSSVIGDR